MNVIKHIRTGETVKRGDEVPTPKGFRVVDSTSYSGRKGARVWVEGLKGSGIVIEAFAASETNCYVTSED